MSEFFYDMSEFLRAMSQCWSAKMPVINWRGLLHCSQWRGTTISPVLPLVVLSLTNVDDLLLFSTLAVWEKHLFDERHWSLLPVSKLFVTVADCFKINCTKPKRHFWWKSKKRSSFLKIYYITVKSYPCTRSWCHIEKVWQTLPTSVVYLGKIAKNWLFLVF